MSKTSYKKTAAKPPIRAGKVFAVILGILLVGVLATSITFNVLMAKQITGGANDKDNPEDPSFVVTPIDTEFMSITPTAFAMSDAPDAHIVRLTATVLPENATDKTVDWAIKFANAASSWASGKTVTDYVTVTPTSDGALTADVQGLQAFGEQIVVTVTSRDNPEAFASCTVDSVVQHTPSLAGFAKVYKDGNGIELKFNKSLGTVDDSTLISAITMNPDFYDEFFLALADYSKTDLMSYAEFIAENSHFKFNTKCNELGFATMGIWQQVTRCETNQNFGYGAPSNESKDFIKALVFDTYENPQYPSEPNRFLYKFNLPSNSSELVYNILLGFNEVAPYSGLSNAVINGINECYQTALVACNIDTPFNFTYKVISKYYETEIVNIPMYIACSENQFLSVRVNGVTVNPGGIVF